MDTQLVQFDITGLYGARDYSIKLTDNNVIIVGENGSGKTTVLKIMYYALSCNWDFLRTFKFDQVTLYFSNNSQASIRLELLEHIFKNYVQPYINRYTDSSPRPIPLRARQRRYYDAVINRLLEIKRAKEKDDVDLFEQLCTEIPLTKKYIDEALQDANVSELLTQTKRIEDYFDATILYLPTYRRIEEQLNVLFPYMERDDWYEARRVSSNYRAIELVEFGMPDVENLLGKYLEHLNDFSRDEQKKLTLGYLSEIIEKKYEDVDLVENIRMLDKQKINNILMRMESSILSDKQKEEIHELLLQIKDNFVAPKQDRDKIICHYFIKLINFDNEMNEEEASLLKFVETCNKYLVSNQLVYEKQRFKCSITNKAFSNKNTSDEIKFQELSSGEKQIVSLFSHLILGESKKIFVFIDEPELSLSMDWQKKFLVDIFESNGCIGLVATTHSPFIFDNDLEKYAHGINEFCTRR